MTEAVRSTNEETECCPSPSGTMRPSWHLEKGSSHTVTLQRVEPAPWGWLGRKFFLGGYGSHLRELCLISLGFCDLSCGHHRRVDPGRHSQRRKGLLHSTDTRRSPDAPYDRSLPRGLATQPRRLVMPSCRARGPSMRPRNVEAPVRRLGV
jgi:hypothetical protein